MSCPVHFMLDIETLGTKPGSAILCLAVRSFDPVQEGVFYACETITLPLVEQLQVGAQIDGDTVAWWCEESRRPLFRRLLGNSLGCRETLAGTFGRLAQLLREPLKAGACIWANSPAFDLVLLEDLFAKAKQPVPWRYWQCRDLRTALGEHGYSRSSDVLPAPAGAHEPDVDCEYQVRVLWAARGGRRAA